MRRAAIRQWILRALALLLGGYLVCALLSAVWLAELHTLRWRSMGWGMVLSEELLDLDSGTAEVSRFGFDQTLVSHTQAALSPDELRELRLVCTLALVPFWRSRYTDPRIADGDQWELTASYGKTEKVVSGSNAYPLFYRLVRDTASRVLAEE